jgi:very-short-patch-repair endonuclease
MPSGVYKHQKLSEAHKANIKRACANQHCGFQKGHKWFGNEETRRKIRLNNTGENNPFYGRKHSETSKVKMSKTHLENPAKYWLGKKRPDMSKRLIGKPLPETTKRKMRENHKGTLGLNLSETTKEKIRKAQRKLWQNPEYVAKSFKAFRVKPTKPEIFLTNLLQEILPNEYRYVGDGQFVLAGKCPDFMNINGQKKLIELFGDYWHRGQNPQDRIDIFKEHGFDTLIIWQSELEDNNLKERIIEFNSI